MAVVPFDTLKFVQKLREAGVPEAHAEALCDVVWDLRVSTILAEKTDLRKVQTPGHGDGGEFPEFMRKLELRLTIKLGVMMLVGMAALAAIVKLL